jgi:hypothetical protein
VEDIGFKGDAVFSNSQLLTVGIILFIVMMIWFFIQKKKDKLLNWISKNHPNKRYKVDIQRVDSQTYLYRIEDDIHSFLVFRSQDGVVLLDKKTRTVVTND